MDLCRIVLNISRYKQNISQSIFKDVYLSMNLMQIWVVLIEERLEVGSNPFLFTLIQYKFKIKLDKLYNSK